MTRKAWARCISSGVSFLALASIAVAQLPAELQPAQSTTVETQPIATDGPYSIWQTVFQSIFVKHAPKREWTPLYANTLFTEGWLEPQIDPPAAPGQQYHDDLSD